MIDLFAQDIRTNDRQSSKGNQLKWENQGVWYKADYAGYEGLSEVVVSHLLKMSTLCSGEYVIYDPEQIRYKSVVYNGVKSKNFLTGKNQIITLERLFDNFFHRSFYQSVFQIADHKKRLCFLVDQVERITGLSGFGSYMNKLFTIDAFFLNEDRHMHNIAVLMDEEGRFDFCPMFDHGAGLLSDTTMDYPLGGNIYDLMGQADAKTISDDFDEQLDLSAELYGQQLFFQFTKKDVNELLDLFSIYSETERKRVEEILYAQMRKYRYLFKCSE